MRRICSYVERHQLPFLIILVAGILLSVLAPFWSIHRYPAFKKVVLNILERISTLTILYLLLDLAGVIIVIIRNI